jgi:uncharacterized membrane protein
MIPENDDGALVPGEDPQTPEVDSQEPSRRASSRVTSSLEITESSYHSPYPPAEELIALNDCVPNGALRAIELVEREQKHRHEMEKSVLAEGALERQAGRRISQTRGWQVVSINLCAFALTAYLGAIGQPWVAGAVLTTTLVPLTAQLLTGGFRTAKPASQPE